MSRIRRPHRSFSANSTITLTAGSGYSGTLSLACSLTSSPQDAQSLPTCSLNPATLTLASGKSTTALLTIQTTAGAKASLVPASFGDGWRWLGGGAGALAALFALVFPMRRWRWTSTLGLLFTIASVSMLGCSGGSTQTSSPTPVSAATTAGTYTFAVTATDQNDAKMTAAATLTVTVQ